MKYILDNKSDSIKSIEENDIKGLAIKSNKDNPINAEKILLIDEQLKSAYINKKINKKLIAILGKMQFVLENPDTDEGDTIMVLGEVERLKGILINKYQIHMKRIEYEVFLRKIVMMENEFKMKYSARQIYKEMLMENFEETERRGR